MSTYYAWSNFPVEKDEWGQVTKTIKVGSEIKQADLGIGDDDWAALVDAGAVRTQKYPDIPENVAPNEYYRSLLRQLGEGQLPEDGFKELSAFQNLAPPPPEPPKVGEIDKDTMTIKPVPSKTG